MNISSLLSAIFVCGCFNYAAASNAILFNANASSTILFVGDIGGTNTRLALYEPGSKSPIFKGEYLNSQFLVKKNNTFEKEIFDPFLTASNISFEEKNIIACFAVAGPVKDNCGVMTNLGQKKSVFKNDAFSMTLNGDSIEDSVVGNLKYIKKCKIINDFVGQGYGLLDLDYDKEVVELIPGSKDMIDPTGPKACLGAGTGLGECYLTTSSFHPEEGYECYPSEGGHADYTPRSDLEVDLLNYLKGKFGESSRISVERVVSGKGLANVYDFLAKKFPDKVSEALHRKFEIAADMQGRVVGMSANSKSTEDACPLCVKAMEIMMSAYGSEAGNCAVKFIPSGGLFVSGGLTPKNMAFIAGENSPFMKAYKDKGRMSPLIERIPLFAVTVEDLGEYELSYFVSFHHCYSYRMH